MRKKLFELSTIQITICYSEFAFKLVLSDLNCQYCRVTAAPSIAQLVERWTVEFVHTVIHRSLVRIRFEGLVLLKCSLLCSLSFFSVLFLTFYDIYYSIANVWPVWLTTVSSFFATFFFMMAIIINIIGNPLSVYAEINLRFSDQ